MMIGSRSPWWYLALAAGAIFFTTLVLLSGPQEHLANIKATTLNKVCDTKEASTAVETKTIYLPVATDGAVVANSGPVQTNHYTGKTQYSLGDKPPVRVVGMIFAGRRATVKILDCYLRRNLAASGGWLDEVIWVIKTDNEDDIAFINQLIQDVPEYVGRTTDRYQGAYQDLQRNTIYVKIDDDVIMFEDHTIPAIVTRVYENKRYSLVSANVMNQPALSFVHYHLGAIHPYLPELKPPEGHSETAPAADWRTSKTPFWSGDKASEEATDPKEPPFKNHKWLRLESESDVTLTPAGKLARDGAEYNSNNIAWESWAIAAQEHYSFLENLEKNELWRYKFDVWNYYYERLSINFIAFDGGLLIDNPVPDGDDEQYLTVELSKQLARPAVVDGSGMAVHFGFFPQSPKLADTDLLSRYQLFADQNICGKPWGSTWEL